jgi:hypothetical protein
MTTHLRRHTTLTRLEDELADINKVKRLLRELLFNKTSERGQRLLWLLDALRKAESMRLAIVELKEPIGGSINLWALSSRMPGASELKLELHRLLREINQRLERYELTPEVSVIDWTLIRFDRSSRKADADEVVLAGWLVDFATNGRGRFPAAILDFRNCLERTCQKLFWNPDQKAKFCRATCRKKYHASDPEKKQQRNEKLRMARRQQNEAAKRQLEDLKRDLQQSRKRRIQ